MKKGRALLQSEPALGLEWRPRPVGVQWLAGVLREGQRPPQSGEQGPCRTAHTSCGGLSSHVEVLTPV